MRNYFKPLHRISGLIIASFLVLHLTNHLFALASPQWHFSVMKYFRMIYRFPPVEVLLMICVLIQICSGLLLILRRGFPKLPAYTILQILSGIYLSLFLVNHVRAVLMARFVWHVDSDFFFAAGVAVHYPEKLFYIPYYSLSVICTFLHIACAHYSRRLELHTMRDETQLLESSKAKYKMEAYAIGITGLVVTVLIMISFTGLLYKI